MHLNERFMNDFKNRFITASLFGIIFWGIVLLFPPLIFSFFLATVLCIILVYEWINFYPLKSWDYWLTMPLYPCMPFILLILMNNNPRYHDLVIILFAIIFSFDTGSYLVGSLFGKHKICPSISKNKTWEGLVGGYFCGLFSFILVLWELHLSLDPAFIIFSALVICILALCGDLFESWLKRRAHLKDSGNLLPGHGGFLDRFDSISFTAPFLFLIKEHLIYFFYT